MALDVPNIMTTLFEKIGQVVKSFEVDILPEFHEVESSSRYWQPRLPQHAVDYVICHCMDAADKLTIRNILGQYQVSAHFSVSPDGHVVCFVDPQHVAYHAGMSAFHSLDKTPNYIKANIPSTTKTLNYTSIGIEFLCPGYAKGGKDWYHFEAFTDAQREAGVQLIKVLVEEFGIPSDNVLGHSDIAPYRKDAQGQVIFSKSDPGASFFWADLRKEGLSLPLPNKESIAQPSIEWIQESLKIIGYCLVPESGQLDLETIYVLLAFQLHFVPKRFDEEGYAQQALLNRDRGLILDPFTIGAIEELRVYILSK